MGKCLLAPNRDKQVDVCEAIHIVDKINDIP